MLKKITLKIAYDVPDYIADEPRRMIDEVKVWAWIDGAFAIHKGIGNKWSNQSKDHWILTHTATSGACKTSRNKQDVIIAMNELKKWNFAGKPFEDAKACDIIEFATLLPAMNGKHYKKESADNYTRNIKPFFEAALGC